jgi:hypothetical protein
MLCRGNCIFKYNSVKFHRVLSQGVSYQSVIAEAWFRTQANSIKVFRGFPKTNAELAPEFSVVLHAFYAVIPTPASTFAPNHRPPFIAFSSNAAVQIENSKLSPYAKLVSSASY